MLLLYVDLELGILIYQLKQVVGTMYLEKIVSVIIVTLEILVMNIIIFLNVEHLTGKGKTVYLQNSLDNTVYNL